MTERQTIDVFIDGLIRYFENLDEALKVGDEGFENIEIGTPYLLQSTKRLGLDYTGMINLSGDYKGSVFVSAPNALLKRILLCYGEAEFSVELMRDLIGEVANTLAGNARRHLGSNFHISVPTVIKGALNTKKLDLNQRCYLLPFRWRGNKAELILSVQKN